MEETELLKIVSKIRKGSVYNIKYCTTLAPSREYKGKVITKETEASVRVGCKYSNLKAVKERRESTPPTTTPHIWWHWMDGFDNIIKVHNTKPDHYLSVQPMPGSKMKSKYFIDGSPATEDEVRAITSPSTWNSSSRDTLDIHIKNVKSFAADERRFTFSSLSFEDIPVKTRSWKKLEDESVISTFEKVMNKAIDLKLVNPSSLVGVYVMPAERRGYGECRSMRFGKGFKHIIGINERVLESPEATLSVIIHEIAHMVKPTDHHGMIFKTSGDAIGRDFGVTVNSSDDFSSLGVKSYFGTPKYIVSCCKCKKEWPYYKKVKILKHIDIYRCPYCESKLKVEGEM